MEDITSLTIAATAKTGKQRRGASGCCGTETVPGNSSPPEKKPRHVTVDDTRDP